MAGWPDGEIREVEQTSYVDGLLRTGRVVPVDHPVLEEILTEPNPLLADPDVSFAFDRVADQERRARMPVFDGYPEPAADLPDPIVDPVPDEPIAEPAPVKRPRARKTS